MGVKWLARTKFESTLFANAGSIPATSTKLINMNWKQEQEALENAFARQLLVEYGIKETTTQRQAKNGTREFEFPVPARYLYYHGKLQASKNRLRLATFKTGYVRNQNSCSSNYQLNKQYKQNTRYTFLTKNGLETKEYITIARARIYSGIARLNYMLEFYLRNYKHNTNTNG